MLSACSNGDYSIETANPDAYDNWYGPDYNASLAGEPTRAGPQSSVDGEPDHTPDPGYTPVEGHSSDSSDSSTDDGELWE